MNGFIGQKLGIDFGFYARHSISCAFVVHNQTKVEDLESPICQPQP